MKMIEKKIKTKKRIKKDNSKKCNEVLFYFALILLIIALVVFFINFLKIIELTGMAVGTANLTVESKTSINFSTNIIDWGSGSVDVGEDNATLNTVAGADNVVNGNWTSNTAGLIIENIGNQNVTLDLKGGKTAQTFFGGTNPSYQYNASNSEEDSCTFNIVEGAFQDVNITGPAGTRVCNVFNVLDSADTIRIDIRVVIPSDATQTGSAIGDILTATATAV